MSSNPLTKARAALERAVEKRGEALLQGKLRRLEKDLNRAQLNVEREREQHHKYRRMYRFALVGMLALGGICMTLLTSECGWDRHAVTER